MKSVAFKEGIKIKTEAHSDLIVSCNYDIRQVRNFNENYSFVFVGPRTKWRTVDMI